MSKDQILRIIQQEKPFLLEKYKVSDIGVFGSVSRGEEKKESDIDILVDFRKETPSLFGLIKLKHYLEDKFGKKVDLIHKSMIKKTLREQILNEVIMA
ncbi:MAG: Nucleotidyltransferase [Candidatus Roizmanbacteria bacterium GW2011_GWC2_41_7]|uniref:Nucleotidyltransferase n=1 Tax=Candidatus Roizmanbacteria bacterium GW2011_GWC2_41_7 TaxID=1618487 RepID=A0A0G0X7Y0_9BACT|nr:MAG: Nucleotidyltransferase [Candidatus Roizmanbacteria bacterium GW2011_GWC2_41_7]